MRFIISLTFFCFFSPLFAADDARWSIIIDAGSTGSRLYLYRYTSAVPVPRIETIFTVSTTPGLSSFASNPAEASESLAPLFKEVDAVLKTRQVDPSSVPVRIFATAGMRLLSDVQQQAIYNNIKATFSEQNTYPLLAAETISGETEAFYGWLDVNYLLRRFETTEPTTGSIELGGASTQIAFETDSKAVLPNERIFEIQKFRYRVLSYSVLNLGQSSARQIMNQDPLAFTCYPDGYALTSTVAGYFDRARCSSVYSNVIETYYPHPIVPPTNQSFVAYGAIYGAFNFFSVDKTPSQTALEQQIDTICYQPWDQLKVQFSKLPEKYLATNCGDALYQDALLFGTYQLTGDRLQVANTLDNQAISWSLGAMLYLVNNAP